jgi:hypothetical protein
VALGSEDLALTFGRRHRFEVWPFPTYFCVLSVPLAADSYGVTLSWSIYTVLFSPRLLPQSLAKLIREHADRNPSSGQRSIADPDPPSKRRERWHSPQVTLIDSKRTMSCGSSDITTQWMGSVFACLNDDARLLVLCGRGHRWSQLKWLADAARPMLEVAEGNGVPWPMV